MFNIIVLARKELEEVLIDYGTMYYETFRKTLLEPDLSFKSFLVIAEFIVSGSIKTLFLILEFNNQSTSVSD